MKPRGSAHDALDRDEAMDGRPRLHHQVAAPTASTLLRVLEFLLATLTALSLERSVLPLAWIFTLALPASLLGRVRSPERLRSRSRWGVLVFAAVLQGLLVLAALEVGRSLPSTGFFAILLLPALYYLAARGQPREALVFILLAACLLFFGLLVRNEMPLILVTTWTAAAAAILLVERDRALREGQLLRMSLLRTPRQRLLRSAFVLAVAMLAAAVSIEVAMSVGFSKADEPEDRQRGPGSERQRRSKVTGVDDRYFLERLDSTDVRLGDEPLCFLAPLDGVPLAADLYLRVSAFVKPTLRSWQLAEATWESAKFHRLLRPRQASREAKLTLLATLEGFVPVPRGLVEIAAHAPLRVDSSLVLARRDDRLGSEDIAVTFQVLKSDTPALAAAGAGGGDTLPGVPSELRSEAFEALLRDLPSGEDVGALFAAIRELFAERFDYVLADPEGQNGAPMLDFFETRRGYCMHFASAAALFLRARGVAARIATGLYQGASGSEAEQVEARARELGLIDEAQLMGDGSLRRAFGAQHAHAWVEVPEAGGAWFVFDPTPVPLRGLQQARAALLAADLEETEPLPWRDLAWIAVLLGLFACAIAFLLVRRRRRRTHAAMVPHVANAEQRAFLVMLERLAAIGLEREGAESLTRFAARIDERPDFAAEDRGVLCAAIETYLELRFGARAGDDERRARLERGRDCASALAVAGRA